MTINNVLLKNEPLHEDEYFVRRVLSGYIEDYGHLYYRHKKKILAICLNFTAGDHAQAYDLCQESFLKAYIRLNQLKDPTRYYQWLSEIARNECISYLRSQKKLRKTLDDYSVLKEALLERGQRWTVLQIQVVQDLIEKINSSELRETIRLFYMEGKKTSEIAQMQGVTQSVVTTRLNRFRAKYSKQIMIEVLERREPPNEL